MFVRWIPLCRERIRPLYDRQCFSSGVQRDIVVLREISNLKESGARAG